MIHKEMSASDETILWYNGYGPVAFIAPDGSTVGTLDAEWVMKAAAEHAQSSKPAA